MDIIFLGTSSGEAIPRVGCGCCQCQSQNSYDKRRRSAILINGKILVDCGPDALRELKSQNVKLKTIKNIIITHTHKDHIGGLRDFRKVNPKAKIIYPKAGDKFEIDKNSFEAFRVPHVKSLETIGLLINNVVYIPDISRIPSNLKSILRETKVIIFDGSCWNRDFGGHIAMTKAIPILKKLPAEKIYFTHNGHTKIPHQELENKIQKLGDRRFKITYDGMEIKI